MFIVNGAIRFFAAPEERNVADLNLRLQHFRSSGALISGVVSVFYKYSAPPELRRLMSAWPVMTLPIFLFYQSVRTLSYKRA